MGKFEHGFGTQLGAVLLWRGVPSASLMLAARSHQTRAAGDRKRDIFSRNSKGKLGSFCGYTIRCCFAVARGPFCKPDACSLEPPNKSCRRQKKRDFF